MLGAILRDLTDPATAEDAIVALARPELLQRVHRTAAADSIPVGVFVASKVRHIVDHGSEDLWVDLLGTMSGSPQPGAAAVERLLARAFPDATRVRVTRSDG